MSARALWETVVELTNAVQPGESSGIRVTQLSISLPVEVMLRMPRDNQSDAEVFADAPRWRWFTPFDQTPSRLTMHLREELAETGGPQ